jgi:hypothetical protein
VFGVLTREFLRGWWRRALRRGVLFMALDGEDRGFLYLAMRVVDEVRSLRVARIIMRIIKRLRDALIGPFARHVIEYGLRRVRTLAAQAVAWGYEVAREWVYDIEFARYLTLMEVYKPSGWGLY